MSVEIEWRRTQRRILIDIDVLRPHPATDLTARRVTALLDTGSTTSGIARSVAHDLQLPSIGKEPVNTAGGTILCDRYLFRIAFPIPGNFPYVFDDIAGFELTDFGSFQALLGMDVLQRCDVKLQHDGVCRLRFHP